jgi:hypothetical protein
VIIELLFHLKLEVVKVARVLVMEVSQLYRLKLHNLDPVQERLSCIVKDALVLDPGDPSNPTVQIES